MEIMLSGKALLDDYKRLLFENNSLTARIAELEATVDRLIESGNALSKVIKRAHWLGGDEAVGRWHNLTGKWKMKKERE